ncbi:PREDICTED: uncharacterized protein LOC109130240 [Camelina sativa]|uniref:Uncharacterized protein LOC109130240 n=1 Tax=Camelina sativa TaxID=90675 RepID=A0ABM1R8B4_CAMSA|nr:PREDICTED: uncharacterized protein LOC109130240 [Camelina sativa]
MYLLTSSLHKVKSKGKDFYAFLCYCIKTLDTVTASQEIFLQRD